MKRFDPEKEEKESIKKLQNTSVVIDKMKRI